MSESALPGWYPQSDGSQRFWDGAGWTDATWSATPPKAKVPRMTKVAAVLLAIGFVEPSLAGVFLFLPIGHRGGSFTQIYFTSIMLIALALFILSFVFALVGYRSTRDAVPRSPVALAVLIFTGICLVPSIAACIAIPLIVPSTPS